MSKLCTPCIAQQVIADTMLQARLLRNLSSFPDGGQRCVYSVQTLDRLGSTYQFDEHAAAGGGGSFAGS